jgi:molybdopterin-biosynthesis enzyme MoeA-like protein
MSNMTTTACLIIIGNEILSGRTQDTNLAHLSGVLNELGIRMTEARVIPDVEETIIATVNECRAAFTMTLQRTASPKLLVLRSKNTPRWRH